MGKDLFVDSVFVHHPSQLSQRGIKIRFKKDFLVSYYQ